MAVANDLFSSTTNTDTSSTSSSSDGTLYVFYQELTESNAQNITFSLYLDSDETAKSLASLLSGKVKVYKSKKVIGSEVDYPVKPNKYTISMNNGKSLGKDAQRGSFYVHHLAESKSLKDIRKSFIGKFDVNFEVAVKCDTISLPYSNPKR